MAMDFTVRVVDPAGRVRVLTRDDISASIMAAGYAPGVGLTQLEFVFARTIRHLDAPKPLHQPTPPKEAA